MKHLDFSDLVPPGTEPKPYWIKLRVCLVISFLIAQMFWEPYVRMLRYIRVFGGEMPDFSYFFLMEDKFPCILCFLVTLMGMIYWAFRFYGSFTRGSRSLYLMKRLPDRWELLRRCVTLPLLGTLVTLLAMALTTAFLYGGYCLFLPR